MSEFYTWSIDSSTGYRKLLIQDIVVNPKTELDKFKTWEGTLKKCKCCERELPCSTYFFKAHPTNKKDGLLHKCKECCSTKYGWGLKQKEQFKLEQKHYCVKCDVVLPLNEIYFSKSKNRPSGYSVTCKKCCISPSNYGINRFLNDMVDVKPDMKICLECLVELPHNQEYYFKTNKSKNGYETKCKRCNGAEYGITQWNKYYQEENMRFCVECFQLKDNEEFYLNDKKKGTRYSRCKKCHYIYYQNRKHQQDQSNYTIDDWEFALDFFKSDDNETSCAYCGIETEQLEKDHIIPFSKGGLLSRENIVPACKSCNCSKNDRELTDFYKARDSFTEDLLRKINDYLAICEDYILVENK